VPDPTGCVEWLGEETSAGCIERSFLIRRLPGPAPGVLWSPQATVPQGTALLFHGGSGNKRSERHLRMGRRLASAGLAVIAIDGAMSVGSPAQYQALAAPAFSRLVPPGQSAPRVGANYRGQSQPARRHDNDIGAISVANTHRDRQASSRRSAARARTEVVRA
jgi:dienelactone hydrolase